MEVCILHYGKAKNKELTVLIRMAGQTRFSYVLKNECSVLAEEKRKGDMSYKRRTFKKVWRFKQDLFFGE